MEQHHLVQKIAKVLYDKKALDITALYVGDMTVITDYMVIACGRSSLQTRALAEEVDDAMAQEGVQLRAKEGMSEGRWIILDFNHVLVHLFHPEERKHYNLERLWADGQNSIDLPFIDDEED